MKKYPVKIAKDYARPSAQFLGLPAIKPGESAELELSAEQAWSLNNKNGVTVTGAPTADPRPAIGRALTDEANAELFEARNADKAAAREGEAVHFVDDLTKEMEKKNAPAPAKKGGDA